MNMKILECIYYYLTCLKERKKNLIEKKRPNTSLGPLSFTFVSDRSFKFLRFQIDPLSFEFVSDKSFKFLRFQIGPLSFEFVSDRSFLSTSVKPKLICPLSETQNLKDQSETLET